MKKPSMSLFQILWLSILSVFLIVGVIFGIYFYERINCKCFDNFCTSSGMDSEGMSAIFTALVFFGFLSVAIFQVHATNLAERERKVEQERSDRLEHNSWWFKVQIARLNTFTNSPPSAENEYCRRTVLKEIEDRWKEVSTSWYERKGVSQQPISQPNK